MKFTKDHRNTLNNIDRVMPRSLSTDSCPDFGVAESHWESFCNALNALQTSLKFYRHLVRMA
jgi:hypothetical protein